MGENLGVGFEEYRGVHSEDERRTANLEEYESWLKEQAVRVRAFQEYGSGFEKTKKDELSRCIQQQLQNLATIRATLSRESVATTQEADTPEALKEVTFDTSS